MRRRTVSLGGILLLSCVSLALLYHLYHYIFNNAAIYMSNVSLEIQEGFGLGQRFSTLNMTSQHSKRIAVVMGIHQDTPLYRASLENHRRYCQLHGYRFMTQSKELVPNRELPFSQPRGNEYQKLSILIQAMIIGLDSKEYDWILWTDLDTFIINPSIPLESLLPPSASNDSAPFFLGNQDHNGFNAGSFFIKVETWSLQLLGMAMADPYLLPRYGLFSPAYNDQASLARIFQMSDFFGKRFHEIPAGWINVYPPNELDGRLDTSIPRVIPMEVQNWILAMEHASRSPLDLDRQAPVSNTIPPPLDDPTISHLRYLLELQSSFIPSAFNGALQIHLVNFRKYQFDYSSLLVINAKIAQVGLAALVVRFHDRLTVKEGLDPSALWRLERESSLWGMNYVQPKGLTERQKSWYDSRKAGVEGMRWLV